MTLIRRIVAALAAGWIFYSPLAQAVQEVPFLAERVSAGTLPPVADRLPQQPLSVDLASLGREPGRHGGEIDILMARGKDTRMMTVYGYARLVGYDPNMILRPDILQNVEVANNKVFTLHLRPGHHWSDGQPFTSDDFRYFWEDMAMNEMLSPFGPPDKLVVNGKPARVEIIDTLTVRYSWDEPNPYFLPALAGPRPLYIYAPSHYLKQFHARYQDEAKLKEEVEFAGVRNWAGLHTRYGHQYKFDNPDLPSLQPWINTTHPPSERFVFERNPYFHRVDTSGLQLPYIDRVLVNISSAGLIPAKAGAGETDLQARYLRLDNYPFLMEGGERNGFNVHLWKRGVGSQMALYPNLNSVDPVWRALVRDIRFRRALSLAVDREEINQVIYFGLVSASANTVLPESPLFKEDYQQAWSDYDLAAANALLDEIGLTERDADGLRLMSDGRALEIVIQTAGESTEQSDLLELIHDTWLQIGIKIHTKPSQREVFRERVYSGEAMMAVWHGYDNGLPTADTPPNEFVPMRQDQLQWPVWGQHHETSGLTGEAPDLAPAKRLLELAEAWRLAGSSDEKEDAWHEVLKIHAEQVYSIGTVSGVPQPVVVSNRLRNVPSEALYAWSPCSYFGMYWPDTFWLEP